jgi:carbonic anhydrase
MNETRARWIVAFPVLALLLTSCAPPLQEASSPPAPAPPPPLVPTAPPAAPSANTNTATTAPSIEPKAAEHHLPHWTYAGDTGPSHWSELSSEWASCKTGTAQSPIDLAKSTTVDPKLSKLELSYGKLPLSVFNNGHTIQVPNSTPASLKVEGHVYQLVQLHMHSPSEHLVDGKPLALELHLVHKDSSGALAVVGLLFNKGRESEALKAVFANAPSEVSAEAKAVTGAELDLGKLLPKSLAYYAYSGSLTTPPCSEGVSWFVLESVGELSEAQLAKFREVTHGDTSRPAQPLGARKLARSK